MPRGRKNTGQTPDQAPEQTPEQIAAEIAKIEAAEAKVQAKAQADADLANFAEFISTGHDTLDPELAKVSAPRPERNAAQLAMDTVVNDTHDKWVSVGRPSQWNRIVDTKAVTRFYADPERSADLKSLVTKAAQVIGMDDDEYPGARIKWGRSFYATPELVARFKLPETYVGREVITFTVMDKKPRAAGSPVTVSHVDDEQDDADEQDDGE